jgi:putative chitinase
MLLQLGSQGSDVEAVQRKLGITADGDFGPVTQASVRAWQSANGLQPDGVVDDVTWAKMFPADSSAPGNTTVAPARASGNLSLSRLQGRIPDGVLAQIEDTAAEFNITSNLRLAHFLAQCAQESEQFAVVYENLNYSAQGLLSTFPRYFDANTAAAYARQPQRIGARVYASRMGNGNEASGDGYAFRGRGYIQLTGRTNYSAFGKSIGKDMVGSPDLVATAYPLASAGYFFNANKIWPLCDAGATDEDVTQVTKRVNGGTNGLANRINYFHQYYGWLTSQS